MKSLSLYPLFLPVSLGLLSSSTVFRPSFPRDYAQSLLPEVEEGALEENKALFIDVCS